MTKDFSIKMILFSLICKVLTALQSKGEKKGEKKIALEWKVRYQLPNKIIRVVKKEKWTISSVAQATGISRSRITQIMKSDTRGISIDVLLRVMDALGNSIKISFKK